jgi:hypothetical protein
VIRQNLLLIPDDGLLVSENLELIPQQEVEPNLIVQELLLIPDDYRLVGDDFLLVLESGLRHCPSLSVDSRWSFDPLKNARPRRAPARAK